NTAHGLGGCREEMTASVPVRLSVRADQSEVGFVDQGGGLERLPRLLLGQLLRGELAQFVVDEGQELRGGVRVALLNGGQNAGDIGHDSEHTARAKICNARAAEDPRAPAEQSSRMLPCDPSRALRAAPMR